MIMSSAMELHSRGGTPILQPPSYAQIRPVRMVKTVSHGKTLAKFKSEGGYCPAGAICLKHFIKEWEIHAPS